MMVSLRLDIRVLLRLIVVAIALLVPAAPAVAATSALDSTFATGGFATTTPLGSYAAAVGVVVQSDGKIVSAGEAEIDGKQYIVATRMLSSGAMDPAFGDAGRVIIDINGSAGANAVRVLPDGKILLGGTGLVNGALAFAAVRLLPDGSRDATFGQSGVATVPIGTGAIANALAVQADGKIVLGGTARTDHNRFAAARLSAGGVLDRTFGTNGVATLPATAAGWGMVLQPDGKIVLAGQGASGTTSYIAGRMLSNGKADTTFGTSGIATIPVGAGAFGDAVALQPDGKILVTGSAWTDRMVAATVRLKPNGALDPTFGSGGLSTVTLWEAVNAMTLQTDGKVVLAATGASAVRLNANGSADQGFGTGGVVRAQIGTSDAATGVTVQPDGRIVLAGCAAISGATVLTVVRLAAL
jgi:uncharacterized delta-60 repeat protein